MKKDPDVLLMMRFAAGDEGSFRQLFSGYNKKVINFCFRFCADRAQAEDLAQEVFLRVFRAGKKYRPEARFSTWLFKIATNVCINSARDRKRRPKTVSMDRPLSHDDDGPQVDIADARITADEEIAEKQRQKRIREAIRRLPEKQRAALLLRVDREFSYQEISNQLRCPVNTVRTLIRRGRIRLVEILDED
ncbi:MAG: sigma-70 family RNA polymerase sigma factor [Deltaproteobacteria bacterium]|nr:sigma-70 family RNA polymerase sigma factor [Deltaproteobacteria bacterium]